MRHASMKYPRFALAGLVAAVLPLRAAQPAQWNSRGPGGGGALFAPSFNPANGNELYIGCDMGELFHSTDGAASWSPVDFRQIVGNRHSEVQYTSNPLIRYALDYSVIAGADLTTPSKSVDGGVTWTRMAADPTGGGAYALYADPNSATNLVVSDYTTLYFSGNGGTSFAARYTDNNGLFVAGAFFDGANIYVATSAGLLVSTNTGASFALSAAGGLPAGSVLASFTGAKVGATTRFFAVTAAAGDVYPGVLVEDFFASTLGWYSLDVGQPNWVSRPTGIAATDHPIFAAMARNNLSIAWLAGQNDNGDPVVYRTTNAGASWQSVLNTSAAQNVATGWSGFGGDRGWGYGGGAVGFTVSPADAARAAWTDYGFIHVTTDGGVSWRQGYLNPADQNPAGSPTPTGRNYRGNGLEDTTTWFMTWSDANNLFASYTDIRGARSSDGGTSWSFNYSGHSLNTMYHAIKHPASTTLYAATSSVHDLFESTYLQDSRIDGGSGLVLFSTNGGAAWQTLHNFGKPVTRVAADPNNANRLYAAVVNHAGAGSAGGIWVSSNINLGASSTWTHLTNPPRTEGHPWSIVVLNDGTLVAAYSGRRDAGGAFTQSSGVFVSTDGGATWLDRSDAGMRYWTKDLILDPYDAAQNTWYAAVFSGWGGAPNGLGGLYKTTNRGANWTRVNALDRVESVTVSPTDTNEMWLTTELDGLWYSANRNAATPTFTAVTNYPFMHPLRVFYNPFNAGEIWVTSFGNGMRVGTIVADSDGDGVPDASDCRPSDGTVWAIPSVAQNLRLAKSGGVALSWNAPAAPGTSAAMQYDALRSLAAGNFSAAVCAATNVTAASATDNPAGGAFYLVRSEDVCGGNLGADSGGTPRSGAGCP